MSNTPAGVTPLLVPIADAFAMIGVGHSKGYALLRDGLIRARKLGAKTLIEVESLRAFVANLPPALQGQAGSEASARARQLRARRRPIPSTAAEHGDGG